MNISAEGRVRASQGGGGGGHWEGGMCTAEGLASPSKQFFMPSCRYSNSLHIINLNSALQDKKK